MSTSREPSVIDTSVAYAASVAVLLMGSALPTGAQGLAVGAALLAGAWLARRPLVRGSHATITLAAMLSAGCLLALGAPRLSPALTASWDLDDTSAHHLGADPMGGDGSVLLFPIVWLSAFFLSAPLPWLAAFVAQRWPTATARVTRGCALVALALGSLVVVRDVLLTRTAPPTERWIESLPVVATLPPLGKGSWVTVPRSPDDRRLSGDDRPSMDWKSLSDQVGVLGLSISRQTETEALWRVGFTRPCGVNPCMDSYFWRHDRGFVVRHDARTGDFFLDDGEVTRALGRQDAVASAVSSLVGPHAVTVRHARDIEGRVRPSWPIALSHAAALVAALVVMRRRRGSPRDERLAADAFAVVLIVVPMAPSLLNLAR